MDEIRRVGVYTRVSTADQSCELQERELRAYVTARGWELVEVYEDQATGTNGQRANFKRLLRDAKERKFDVVVCWKLDRLFRSLKDLIGTLQEFAELGISFISLKDQIDLSTASGRLMMHMVGAFAEFEASLIRERVRAGLANAKAKGKKLGRPPTIDAARVLELREQGLSLREIAASVGSTKGAICKTLQRQISSKSVNSMW